MKNQSRNLIRAKTVKVTRNQPRNSTIFSVYPKANEEKIVEENWFSQL